MQKPTALRNFPCVQSLFYFEYIIVVGGRDTGQTPFVRFWAATPIWRPHGIPRDRHGVGASKSVLLVS